MNRIARAFAAGLILGLPAWAAAQPAAAPSGHGLDDLYRITAGVFDSHVEYHKINIARGGEVVLADLKGPGKITYWYITDNAGGNFYPGLVLKVYWDGDDKPAINAPLSDFFGAMRGKTIEYQSAPMQINHRSFMCYLPMPFSKGARFVLANDGDKDYSQSVAYGIDYEKDEKYVAEPSRLHCVWSRSNPVEAGMHTLLEVSGRGHYIGNFLQVFSRYDSWWGEGDTIFYVDGNKITHSPGTEDEYGACWFADFGVRFSGTYYGYLQNERKGNSLMYRWYLTNPVRFQKSLKVEIQNQHRNGTPTGPADADDYVSIAYWYQDTPTQSAALQPFADRTAPSKAVESRKQ